LGLLSSQLVQESGCQETWCHPLPWI